MSEPKARTLLQRSDQLREAARKTHLGIFLTKEFQELFEDVIRYILENFDPLPAIPSSRSSGFNINVSANDKEYLKKFSQLGIYPYQFTFKLAEC